MQLTIEVPDHFTAKSLEDYPAHLNAKFCWTGADIMQKVLDALVAKEAAEKAEAERERFIATGKDFVAAGLDPWKAIYTSYGYIDGDYWYEITNPEDLGLTNHTPVVLPDPEPLPELHTYIKPEQVREGMKVSVTEESIGLEKGASRVRYTEGTVTDINASQYGPNAPKVGGVRLQLANRNDANVTIYFFGMDEEVAA